ncbi:MAG TPA: hypothetical protein VMR34_06230 [Candidatus Saccharimonadales bacterium]|nr:hypothetical protein [Candidatus Saccharimonadales bacterium]
MSIESDIRERNEERQKFKVRSIRTLGEFGVMLLTDGVIDDMHIHPDRDVHGFFKFVRLPVDDPREADDRLDAVLHVQAYPGMSTEEELSVRARMMNGVALRDIRANGDAAIGNEHAAALFDLFEEIRASVPGYDPSVLRDMVIDALVYTY